MWEAKSRTGVETFRIYPSLSTTMLETPNLELEIFHRYEDEKQVGLGYVSVCGVYVLVSKGACKVYGVDKNLNNSSNMWQQKQHRIGKKKRKGEINPATHQ